MIRLAKQEDGRAVAAIYEPYVKSSSISFEAVPPSAAEMAGRMTSCVGPWLIFERGGRPLGYAYGSKHRDRAAYEWSVDVSVYVDAAHHRTGVGRALYASLLALLRLQGFYAAHAGITLPNGASVGLHESLGFRRIGVYPSVGYKHGAWHDVGWWQLSLRERDAAPRSPRTVEDARRDPEWAATLQAGRATEDA